ncbi:hypothetical protein GCM10022276_23700 [Sphingomonas limnosediminicola]|jgi:hypothetical protein|uniref:Uncharacterized protein n=2 Tax=Sphingomonas limnosediminicola TaxID=940133 RepID=A0ABP7LNU4_9SPHN
MTGGRIIELVAAAVILGAGVWLYRARKDADQSYGSQGAVLLFVVAAILGVHALGGLDYRPSSSELEAAQRR